MQELDIGSVVQALTFLEKTRLLHHAFDTLLAIFSHVGLLRLQVDGEVTARQHLCLRILIIDEDDVCPALVGHLHSSVQRHGTVANGCALLIGKLHRLEGNVVVDELFGFFVRLEIRDQFVDLRIQVGAGIGRAGNNQRCAGFIDQD